MDKTAQAKLFSRIEDRLKVISTNSEEEWVRAVSAEVLADVRKIKEDVAGKPPTFSCPQTRHGIEL